MVEVVEAMIGDGPASFEALRQRLALEVEHFRHAFEDHGGRGERGLRAALRNDRHARHDGVDLCGIEHAEGCERGQHAADFAERFGFELAEVVVAARLEVDHLHRMAGIGEHDRNAAPHAAGTETGDGVACRHGQPQNSHVSRARCST